jgi:hypothetical protein
MNKKRRRNNTWLLVAETSVHSFPTTSLRRRKMLRRSLAMIAVGLAWFALTSQAGWAGLVDDIKRVAENFGIEMTDKPTTFEVRDNGMSNRVWHKGTVVQAGTLNLRGCGQLQSKDGDPVEFVRYSSSMVAVKNLRTGKQCIAQHGPQP